MVGHGNEVGIYYNYGASTYYYHSDPGTQTNDSTDAVISASIACYTGAFDEGYSWSNYDCMAERMINSNKTCGTANIMNSRYGWGYSNWPNSLGPSGEFSVWFYRKLFNTSAYHIGEVLAAGKDQLVPSSISNTYWRWCHYEFNLIGDPEMPVWTDDVQSLAVSYSSDTIAQYGNGSPDTFTVTVTDGSDRAPVSGALVTIMRDSTAYERVYTDGSGQAQFILPDDTFNSPGYAWVTVTKYIDNFIPDLDSAIVTSSGVDVEETPQEELAYYNFALSPNPAKTDIHMHFGAPLQHTLTVHLYDIAGSLVKSFTVNQGRRETNVPVSELSNGVYFVRTIGDITTHEKVILVK
jgi:hypothetical protein